MMSWSRVIFSLMILSLAAFPAGAVVITESADTYVDSASPNTAFVESPSINVSQHAFGLIRFGLTALPTGTTTSQITKATLQLWQMPDSPNVAGSISVYEVTSDFAMRTVTYNTRPSLAAAPVATVVLPGNSRYVEVDITPLVKKWMTAPTGNYGIAVLPASFPTSLDVHLGTKWNLAASQPPILDISLTGARTVAVCVDGAECSCAGTLVSKVSTGFGDSSHYGSCTVTSDTGSCYAQSRDGYYGINEGSCCVCAVR